jgi:hypothetical protein
MEVIKKARKRKFLDSLEKYHIFLPSKQQTHMNEFNIDQGNPIFEVIHKTLTIQPHSGMKTHPLSCPF